MSYKRKIEKIVSGLKLMRTLRLIWSHSRILSILTILMIAVQNGLLLAAAYFFKKIINVISLAGHSPDKMRLISQYLIETFLISLTWIFVKSITAYITELQAAKIGEYIDDKIHASAIELDMAFYESPEYFDILKRAKDAGAERPNAIVTSLVDVIKNMAMLITIACVIIYISWALIPILILCIIPAFFTRIITAKKLYLLRQSQTPSERKASYISSLISTDTLAKEIKGFNLGEYFKTQYSEIRMALLAQRFYIIRKNAIYEIITDVLSIMAFFGCIVYIVWIAINGKIKVGEITLFLFMFPQLFVVLQGLSQGISTIYKDNIFIANLFKLFDLKPLLSETDKPLPIPDKENIDMEIENLCFTYPHSTEQTLNTINLKIPAGKIIAVVGLNGAGKTTLIKLLCRLYDPTSGSIKIDGIDIRNFKSVEFRKKISIVFQDFGRYNISANENIQLGDIYAQRSANDIKDAAVHSGANTFINKLSEKYETIMGRVFENGQEISIGQWQKLAIARALYSPSKFIILDEATSALDAKAEKEFFDSFRENIGNRGALVISHRLSAVEHADYIYVMSEGRIQQAGTHEELINTEGDYALLFRKNVDAGSIIT